VRYKLADFLGISQDKLNPDPWQRDIHGARPVDPQIRAVPFIDIQASAGAGSVIDAVEDHDIEQWHLPKQWLRQLGNGQIDSLKPLSVSGDPMVPRLLHGDIVMIDTPQRTASPPGIFVLHGGLGLVIKQIEPIPNTSPITLRMFSDNNAYSAYDRSIDEVSIIGRVVWFARTI
jgi:phage repressor protein C with HTH and peptisase S24 domain